jgi:hypothetical protein
MSFASTLDTTIVGREGGAEGFSNVGSRPNEENEGALTSIPPVTSSEFVTATLELALIVIILYTDDS